MNKNKKKSVCFFFFFWKFKKKMKSNKLDLKAQLMHMIQPKPFKKQHYKQNSSAYHIYQHTHIHTIFEKHKIFPKFTNIRTTSTGSNELCRLPNSKHVHRLSPTWQRNIAPPQDLALYCNFIFEILHFFFFETTRMLDEK